MSYWNRKGRRRAPRTEHPSPAPGELATLQAFLNTTSFGKEPDELEDAERLAGWLSRHGLLDAAIRLSQSEWQRALHVRSGLRAALHANSGGTLDAKAIRRLELAAGKARLEFRFDDAGPVGFRPGSRTFDDALGGLLATAATARLEGLWSAFKLCARDGCRRAFFDRSKSQTGKWCNARCGDRVRAEAHRKAGKRKAGYGRK